MSNIVEEFLLLIDEMGAIDNSIFPWYFEVHPDTSKHDSPQPVINTSKYYSPQPLINLVNIFFLDFCIFSLNLQTLWTMRDRICCEHTSNAYVIGSKK